VVLATRQPANAFVNPDILEVLAPTTKEESEPLVTKPGRPSHLDTTSVLCALTDVKNVVAQHVETATEIQARALAKTGGLEVLAVAVTENSELPHTAQQQTVPTHSTELPPHPPIIIATSPQLPFLE